jgi:hypothetical protein
MTKRKNEPPMRLDLSFEEALARLAQVDPAEILDAHCKVQQAQEDVEKDVAERRESIRRGARRTAHRFRI